VRKLFIILLIALFLVSGCVREKIIEKEAECVAPRIMYDGECCLDSDESGVCDIVEEALIRSEAIEAEAKAEAAKIKTPDECVEMSSWVVCEDLDITYDKVIGGLIKIQLGNNREGILVIKKFKFPEMPSCDKELSWNRDTTGIGIEGSAKYTIECDALAGIDVLETEIQMDVNFYEKVQGLEAHKEVQYMEEVKQTIKGTIKGST